MLASDDGDAHPRSSSRGASASPRPAPLGTRRPTKRRPLSPAATTPASRPATAKRLKRFAVYWALRVVAAGVRRLPLRWALLVGGAAGRALYAIDRRRAGRARAQLAAALGCDGATAGRMARASYGHLGMLVAEWARLPASRSQLVRWVELPPADEARLRAAVAQGRGVVFVSGHVGNWELLAHRIAAAGFDAATVARRPSNAHLDRWLSAVRAHVGLETIERGRPDAARRVLAALRRGAVLGVLIDQRTRVESVDVEFFGRPAPTPVAAAALALRSERPVLVGTLRRDARGRHRITIQRVPLPPSGARAARTRALTARLSWTLEAAIRRAPAQWPWFHDRWGIRLDATAGKPSSKT